MLQQRLEQDTVFLYDSLAHISSNDLLEREVVDTIKIDTIHAVKILHPEQPRYEGIHLPSTIGQTDSVFGLLLLSFLFFAHIYSGGFTMLKENVRLLFSSDKTPRVHRQITANETLYSFFLIFQAIVFMSVCIYDAFVEYDSLLIGYRHPLPTILAFIIFIALFFGAKNLLYIILGYIFDRRREVAVWQRTLAVSVEILGILYFIPTLLLLYTGVYGFQIIIFMIILFLLVQITLFYQIIIFFVGEKFNFLYLIAYLCTFEILPFVYLFIGLVYLYRIDVFNTLWL